MLLRLVFAFIFFNLGNVAFAGTSQDFFFVDETGARQIQLLELETVLSLEDSTAQPIDLDAANAMLRINAVSAARQPFASIQVWLKNPASDRRELVGSLGGFFAPVRGHHGEGRNLGYTAWSF